MSWHLKNFILSILVLIVGSASADLRPNNGANLHKSFAYQDADAARWRRHIMTEARQNGRTILLVIDEPLQGERPQQVVLRQSFAANQQAEFAAAFAKAHSLSAPPPFATRMTVTQNPIWTITHKWTSADEQDYSDWITHNAATDMLVGAGLNVDCADFAITMRWIYSHDHHLPAGDELAGSGQLWGSWLSTTTWDHLPTSANWKQDERFKAALKYVLTNSYTHTIIDDLYPVHIDPTYVRGGTIYLTISGETGHTRTIFNVGAGNTCPDSNPCISIIYGNEPASEYGYVDSLVPYWLQSGEGGFLRFRWPERGFGGSWHLRAPSDMPGYSMEQFNWNSNNYLDNVSTRLSLWGSPEQRYISMGTTLHSTLVRRIQITERGYYICSLVPCSTDSTDYGNWSTPERDSTFNLQLGTFKQAGQQLDLSSPDIQDFYNSEKTEIFERANVTFYNVLVNGAGASFSSDPTQDIFKRWGAQLSSARDRASVLARVAIDNLSWRDDLVTSALLLCYANGSGTVTCHPDDDAVKNLSTDRLDQAFRRAQSDLANLYHSAPPEVQAQIAEDLKAMISIVPLCGTADSSTNCTAYDLLLDQPTHIQTMSSVPTDPLNKRWGF